MVVWLGVGCSAATDENAPQFHPLYPTASAGTGGMTAVAMGGATGGVAPVTTAGAAGLGSGGTLAAGGTPMASGGMGGASAQAGAGTTDPAELLYQANCMVCHGMDADGDDLLGPEIRHPVRDHAEWLVRNGRADTTYMGAMLPLDMTMLSDADMALIFDYLDSFPQPTTGQGLYHDYCENCHGSDARGGPTERDLSEHANFADVTENTRGGHHPGEFDNRGEYMPVLGNDRLTDQELQLIADYVATLL
jgi:mono/diheme cytochrome c family protein